MMGRLLSPEELARLPPCAPIVASKGLHPRYLGDAAIRGYRDRPLADLRAVLGLDAEEAVIVGGIGTLVLRSGGNEFAPAPSLMSRAGSLLSAGGDALVRAATGQPVLVDAATRDRRLATCADCPLWDDAAGRCGACGCFTRAKAALAGERCPQGLW